MAYLVLTRALAEGISHEFEAPLETPERVLVVKRGNLVSTNLLGKIKQFLISYGQAQSRLWPGPVFLKGLAKPTRPSRAGTAQALAHVVLGSD